MGGQRIQRALTKAYNDGIDLDLRSWSEPDRTIGANALSAIIRRAAGNADPRTGPLVTGLIVTSDADGTEKFDLDSVTLTFSLRFADCHFSCAVILIDSTVRRLQFEGCQFNQGFDALGVRALSVSLDRSYVIGTVDCSQSNITRNLSLSNCFMNEGEIRLVGANIGGQLAMRKAKLANIGKNTLYADGVTIFGDALLDDDFESYGEIRLIDATIRGRLGMGGAKLVNPAHNGPNGDGAKVANNTLNAAGQQSSEDYS
jgi:hypothetical protein